MIYFLNILTHRMFVSALTTKTMDATVFEIKENNNNIENKHNNQEREK